MQNQHNDSYEFLWGGGRVGALPRDQVSLLQLGPLSFGLNAMVASPRGLTRYQNPTSLLIKEKQGALVGVH